jgi:hypothetical protein
MENHTMTPSSHHVAPEHNLNTPMRADSESQRHPRGKIMRHFLFLIVGLSLANSCGAAIGHTQTLPREDNIWGGYAHQPTQSQVIRQEQRAGIPTSRQEQRFDNDEVESIYSQLMRETAPQS